MEDDSQPVTEQENPLSSNIDILSAVEIVSVLQACDKEIFSGWKNFPGLFDERIQTNMARIVHIAVEILKDASRSSIIFGGCGTSGRLGFVTARTFNAHLREQGVTECYHGIHAGGDRALFISQEAVEDDPVLGAELLKKAAHGKHKVLYFGITCGLSAPFVAGQLDYCLKHKEQFTPVLIGFNPACQARNTPVDKWNRTFLQVVQQLQGAEACGEGFILNPVVGPEPITGSSRMKSGTATKLLLEAMLVPAHATFCVHIDLSIKDYLLQYKQVWEKVYQEKSDIGILLQLAGSSLNEDGHIYYFGSGSLGIMGLIDASECPPTYGATLDDVRGFLEGGYETLQNPQGDLSAFGIHFQISSEDFQQRVVPSLTEKDLVIFISLDKPVMLTKEMQAASCKKACIVLNSVKNGRPVIGSSINLKITIDLSGVMTSPLILDTNLQSLVSSLLAELAVKWTLNAVSTGAHILKGKVFNNNMIDLKPSNVKLFHRAVGIIQRYSKLPREICQEYLLRSLYGTDDITEDIREHSITHHIQNGATKLRVVPTALLAALLKCRISEADRALHQLPVLRQVILNTLSAQDRIM